MDLSVSLAVAEYGRYSVKFKETVANNATQRVENANTKIFPHTLLVTNMEKHPLMTLLYYYNTLCAYNAMYH